MGYLEDTLSTGETAVYEARFHWTYTLGAWIILIAGLVAAGFVWALLQKAVPGWQWLGYVVFAVFALQFLRLMIVKWTTEIAVTNHRFLYKRGWIARSTQELPMRRIEEVNVDQSLLGRIFGFGKVQVYGTGGDRPIATPSIDEPLRLRGAVVDAAQGSAARTGPDAPQAAFEREEAVRRDPPVAPEE